MLTFRERDRYRFFPTATTTGQETRTRRYCRRSCFDGFDITGGLGITDELAMTVRLGNSRANQNNPKKPLVAQGRWENCSILTVTRLSDPGHPGVRRAGKGFSVIAGLLDRAEWGGLKYLRTLEPGAGAAGLRAFDERSF
jgi:hypothetical protein